jgi:hypothetical protein
MPSLHEQTLARTVHRYKMGFAAKAVCQIQVKLLNCKNNPFRNRSTKIKVKLLFQTQIKNIIQAIQSLAGHVHSPTEHSKNV